MKFRQKKILEQKRHWRVRRKVNGTPERPRLAISFSNKHVYAQCIDDKSGRTLAAVCTTSKELKGEKILPNVEGSKVVGEKMGSKLKEAGVSAIVLDRGARRYHGCVKAFADALRSTGINF